MYQYKMSLKKPESVPIPDKRAALNRLGEKSASCKNTEAGSLTTLQPRPWNARVGFSAGHYN
jgi:hypothetical protein